jgi:hypothetical protein
MTGLPRRREQSLVIREVDGETLVYDLTRDRAHCLNRTAALVWRSLDGTKEIAQVAGEVARTLGIEPDEPLVWVALEQLQRAKLLSEPPVRPAGAREVSRRALIGRLARSGAAAVLVPSVMSLIVPQAAHAATCIPKNQVCRDANKTLIAPCCDNQPCPTPKNSKCPK